MQNIFFDNGVLFIFLLLGCSGNMKNIKYYASFSGYSIPLNPVEEISKRKALSSVPYCIGYYDHKQNLVVFEKWIEEELFFRHEYKYRDNGVIYESKIQNSEGKITVQYFDNKGNFISSNTSDN